MTDDQCAREITWAGGTHTFTLNHPWVRNVLSFRGIPGPGGNSPAACLAQFEAGNYSPDDVERVIELGLIGGGTPEREVEALLDTHVRNKPLGPNILIAHQVLAALFVGTPEPTEAS
ncbi:gene transfer agent family protein [Bradyrhizobium sp. NP1]|uniref:gene transfer agent family protein n=1 Tax=Bradyrhizobium sp. NP1 TaxID=3049772 RepID=UPI0025A631BB|nr:gene transfer agent family protein [Bradyrhizobium sp. NP1]WJR76017.1 gene transfer agent family protein [Bradyrhizobium sp. NP1]